MNNLQEGIDFYWIEVENIKYRVFTEHYLLKRNYCCNNKCHHCPYKKNKDGKEIK